MRFRHWNSPIRAPSGRVAPRPGAPPTVERLEDRLTPSVSGPPFDFSNSFYLANGINPTNVQQRVGTPTSASAFVVENSSPDANHTNDRITETTGGMDRATSCTTPSTGS